MTTARTSRPRRAPAMAAAAAATLMALAAAPAGAGELFDQATLDFAARLDLSGWELVVAHEAGRAKILDTVARRRLRHFYGAASIDGACPTFAWLEVYFNAGAYLDRPAIRLKDERLRSRLAPHLSAADAEMLSRTGRLAPIELFNEPAAAALLARGRASDEQIDRRRMGRLTAALKAASRTDRATHRAARRLLGRMEAFTAAEAMRIFPPSGTGPYRSPEELARIAAGDERPPGFTAADAAKLEATFAAVGEAWRRRDAERTNKLSAELLAALTGRAGATCPPTWRRRLERFHNRVFGLTIAWAGFFLAALLLLASLATRRRWLRRTGLSVFVLSTGAVVAGVILRWIISGRGWRLPPLTNQYESVLGAAMMAGLAGCALEAVFRKGVLALAASLFAAAALLALFFQLGPLQGDINAPAALLNTSILTWHVATLMIGYGIIGMSAVVSVAYLLVALGRIWRGDRRREGAALPAELDRYNLVLLQLACWMVAIGDALGAFWADRAWGRWWGWDAKETWGLMTLLVYLGIIHVRHVLGPRKRGAWTAALALLGCAVMGFTWWGVNYLLRGLHAYA